MLHLFVISTTEREEKSKNNSKRFLPSAIIVTLVE